MLLQQCCSHAKPWLAVSVQKQKHSTVKLLQATARDAERGAGRSWPGTQGGEDRRPAQDAGHGHSHGHQQCLHTTPADEGLPNDGTGDRQPVRSIEGLLQTCLLERHCCLVQVTMIMTDVEGSTELWEQDSVAADKAIALHDSILRRLLPSYYGFEVSRRSLSWRRAYSLLLSLLLHAGRAAPWHRAVLCSLPHHMPDSIGAFAWWWCC